MSPHEVFSAVKAEYDEATAVRVVAIYSVQLTLKPKLADLEQPGSFTERLNRRSRKLLWREEARDFEQAFAITLALYSYDVGRALAGLGGGCARSLRELVAAESGIKETCA